MNATLTLDKAGRVVLPKAIRQELQIEPGDSLELEATEDQIVLRPARGNGRMKKVRGVWVFHSGHPMAPELAKKAVEKVRRERDRKVLGIHP
ncbi:MAG TPA: AbrB/MazE/SpoVT family DNA-binding domain-containing protein [Terriglobales bacterium]|jgi:AbrB family looped-hinge helix DNA binding protein